MPVASRLVQRATRVGVGALCGLATSCSGGSASPSASDDRTSAAEAAAPVPVPEPGAWAVQIETTHTRGEDDVRQSAQGRVRLALDAEQGSSRRLHLSGPQRDERWTVEPWGGTISSLGAPTRAWVRSGVRDAAVPGDATVMLQTTPSTDGCVVLEATWEQAAPGAPAAFATWQVEERRRWCAPGVETEYAVVRRSLAGTMTTAWLLAP
jgi:hypothetical protein